MSIYNRQEPVDLSSALFLVDDALLVSEAELTELVSDSFDELFGDTRSVTTVSEEKGQDTD